MKSLCSVSLLVVLLVCLSLMSMAAPTVSSISPTSGPTTGGTSVTITGTNFVSGATVAFGGTAATGVTVVTLFGLREPKFRAQYLRGVLKVFSSLYLAFLVESIVLMNVRPALVIVQVALTIAAVAILVALGLLLYRSELSVWRVSTSPQVG